MKRSNHILFYVFIAAALLALSVVSWDYTIGHRGENPLNPRTCPLCSAFDSFAAGLTFLAASLCLFLPVFCMPIDFSICRYSRMIQARILRLRAPPRV